MEIQPHQLLMPAIILHLSSSYVPVTEFHSTLTKAAHAHKHLPARTCNQLKIVILAHLWVGELCCLSITEGERQESM